MSTPGDLRLCGASGEVEVVDLDSARDLARVAAFFLEMADYVRLERDAAPTPSLALDFFAEAPRGLDPASSRRLAVEERPGGPLVALAELSFGFPAPGDAYLGLFHVVPEHRGQGLGTRFLARVEDLARLSGAWRLFLAVLDANPRGRKFWTRHGYLPAAPPRDIAVGEVTRRAQRLGKALG